MPKKQAAPDFEQAIAELEQLVERLERGDDALESALSQFERGVELTRICQQALSRAEQRVEQLLERDGEPVIAPLDTDGRG